MLSNFNKEALLRQEFDDWECTFCTSISSSTHRFSHNDSLETSKICMFDFSDLENVRCLRLTCQLPSKSDLINFFSPCLGAGSFPDKILYSLDFTVLYSFLNPNDSCNPTGLVSKAKGSLSDTGIICFTMHFDRN